MKLQTGMGGTLITLNNLDGHSSADIFCLSSFSELSLFVFFSLSNNILPVRRICLILITILWMTKDTFQGSENHYVKYKLVELLTLVIK